MKKIIGFILLGVMLVVGALAFTLSVIRVDENKTISRPSNIYIFTNRTQGNKSGYNGYKLHDKGNGAKKISEIYNLLDDAFGQSALSALFGGSKETASHKKEQAGATEVMDKSLNNTEKYTIVFYYSTPKTISVKDDNFEYQYLFFEVSKDYSNEVIFGVNNTEKIDIENTTDSSKNLPYVYSYTAKINLNNLYDYLYNFDLSL